MPLHNAPTVAVLRAGSAPVWASLQSETAIRALHRRNLG